MVVCCLLHPPRAAPKRSTERQSAPGMEIHPAKENTRHKPKILRDGAWGDVQDFSRYHEEKMQLEEETKIHRTALRNTSNEYKELRFVYLLWLQVLG